MFCRTNSWTSGHAQVLLSSIDQFNEQFFIPIQFLSVHLPVLSADPFDSNGIGYNETVREVGQFHDHRAAGHRDST
jgi:hypothetical protein